MIPRGTKKDFAYQEGPSTTPRCEKCQYFIEGGGCALVKGKISGKTGSCNFWVRGETLKEAPRNVPPFTKEQSGYVQNDPNGPRCGVCRFYREPRGCSLVKGDIDPRIGCCSAYKKKVL